MRAPLLRRRLGQAGVRTDEIAECRNAMTLFMAHLSDPGGAVRRANGRTRRRAPQRLLHTIGRHGRVPATESRLLRKRFAVSAAKTRPLCA